MKQNKYKILLVEDEANIRNLVATMLDTSGYQTILAQCCSDARIMYLSYLPDLIVLDLGLPDQDGMRLLDFVRQNSSTPIIILSARADEAIKSPPWTQAPTTTSPSPLAQGNCWPEYGLPCATTASVRKRDGCRAGDLF